MKRPQQHQVDSAGQRQLRAALEPKGWTLNPTAQDYGVDFDIEVFHDNATTGVCFKLQLKSSASSPYSSDRSFISQELELPNARYLARELHTPVILAHADVRTGHVFWCAPQLPGVVPDLAVSADRSTITVRIPTARNLVDTVDDLLSALAAIETLLATRVVAHASMTTFAGAMRGAADREKVIKGLQSKGDLLKLEQAAELFAAGKLHEARTYALGVIQDLGASVEAKVDAFVQVEAIDTRFLVSARASDAERIHRHLEVSLEMRRLAKRGPPAVKLFAMLAKVAAELEVLTHKDWGLFLAWRTQVHRGDMFALARVAHLRGETARRLAAKYRQALRLVALTARSPHRAPQPRALTRVAGALMTLIERLRLEGLEDVRSAFMDHYFQICELGERIGTEVGDDVARGLSAHMALVLCTSEEEPRARWALEVFAQIKDGEAGRHVAGLLDGWRRRRRGERLEGDIETTQRQILENIASGLGVDLASTTDPVAAVVRVGIADADPTRVLRGCEYTFVSIGSRSPLSAWFGLQTIGTKIIHCTKHGHAIENASLDEAFLMFKARYCQTCPDVKPRTVEWQHSDTWQEAENARHAEFLKQWLAARKSPC